MANRRNRIIYASQSVFAEGKVLYRVQTLGSTTTFNTSDIFQLGELNLTDVVEDSPDVAVTLDGFDYGSIYTMATLAKVPTHNLHHNIRQSDGVTFYDAVSGIDVSTGDLDEVAGLPAGSGTGKANIVIKDGNAALAYLHGVQLPDFARECGVSKGVDVWAPVQTECALGTTNAEIEMTKHLKDVFINRVELNYQSNDNSAENYAGETEKKTWYLNQARFLSWEEWHIGPLSSQVAPSTFGAKDGLQLALNTPSEVATLENGNIGFLKSTTAGRPAVLFTFVKGGGLSVGESKAVAVFDKDVCIPSNALEYFLYDASDNSLSYYINGSAGTLADILPAGRSAYIAGDRAYVSYAANAYAEEESGSRPVGSDATIVVGKYFAPIGTEDVEDVGAIRQGQVEAYLVDPDLVFKDELTGDSITATGITFAAGINSQIDLTKFVGLPLVVVGGPGKGGPAREIIAATNALSGATNSGTVILGGSDWANIRLQEDTAQTSTVSGVYVDKLCGIDSDYVGATITVTVTGSPEVAAIASVDTVNKYIEFDTPVSAAPDDGSDVLVSVEPTANSIVLVGEYRLALRLQNVVVTSDMAREMQKELGHLDPYARTITLPIPFTTSMDTTASDLETFAILAGKLNKYENNDLANIDINDLVAKDNLAVVVMIYQQTDKQAGGTGVDRKVLSADMFGDEYFVNGIRNVYDATDGSAREYPLKTVIAKNLRVTDENYNLAQGGNATQTFAYRGTNEVTVVRGYVGVDLVVKTIESQGE